MREHGGFEGNAQTLHILARLEKKNTRSVPEDFKPFTEEGEDNRLGLNLSYRSLASVLKYDDIIPIKSDDRAAGKKKKVVKGYYQSEATLVERIKEAVIGDKKYQGFKTIECSIMDIADDIAYSTYDIEDIFKSGFLKPLDFFNLDHSIYESVVDTINERIEKQYLSEKRRATIEDVYEVLYIAFRDIFTVSEADIKTAKRRSISPEQKKMLFSAQANEYSQLIAENGYHRTDFTSNLIQLFLEGVEVERDISYLQLNKARLNIDTFIMVETLKNITYQAIIRSPALQVVEFRGKDIVKKIFDAIVNQDGDRLMPNDFRTLYRTVKTDSERHRVVCDFIAGMTDRYAVEFYSRLYGANGLTMHKPL